MRKIFRWLFKDDIKEIEERYKAFDEHIREALYNNQLYYDELKKQIRKTDELLSNIDVSVDVHTYSPSWAVISLQGQKADYIKFVNLCDYDLREIQKFISRYDRSKVDAMPYESKLLRVNKY